MNRLQEITVLDCDGQLPPFMRTTKRMRILRKPNSKILRKTQNIFLMCLATQLPEMADLVRDVMSRLRALFVYQDVPSTFIIPLLKRAELRVSSRILLHKDRALATRVLKAWELGAPDQLIANACAANSKLFVLSCSLKEYEISFDTVSALNSIPPGERGRFTIADDGRYLHWPSSDIHLDIDALRYATDPQWRKKIDWERTTHHARFGAAVEAVRKSHRLNQSDISGVSERQIRRIEKGSVPRVKTLEIMARVHGLALDDYLSKVAEKAASLPTAAS
jgi:hypothetical protein